MLREHLISLWLRACEDTETESHAGFVGGDLSLKDRHGNSIRVNSKTAETPNQIMPFLLKGEKVDFKPIPISQSEFKRLYDAWAQGWESKLFRKWNNENKE